MPTSTTPASWGGVVTAMAPFAGASAVCAGTPPKVTVQGGVNLVPKTLMVSPPDVRPDFCERLVMARPDGSLAWTTNSMLVRPPTSPSGSGRTTLTVVVPAASACTGMMALPVTSRAALAGTSATDATVCVILSEFDVVGGGSILTFTFVDAPTASDTTTGSSVTVTGSKTSTLHEYTRPPRDGGRVTK